MILFQPVTGAAIDDDESNDDDDDDDSIREKSDDCFMKMYE